MHSRLRLYRNRITALRADNGTPEWHEAKAEIRGYHGDTLGALCHALAAGFQRLATAVKPMVAGIADAMADFADAINAANDAAEAYPKFWEVGDV